MIHARKVNQLAKQAGITVGNNVNGLYGLPSVPQLREFVRLWQAEEDRMRALRNDPPPVQAYPDNGGW